MTTFELDDVTGILLQPEDRDTAGDLVLWLSHLGGSAEKELPTMQRIAATGRPVVGFDAPLHGRRATSEDPWAFATEVLASFRQRMWPILGRTTLEAMRVLSWAQEQVGQVGRPVVAGGISMGGDVAVALAGIDERVSRVVTLGSTPNWRRPDMRVLADPEQVVDQGEADPYSRWYADHLDPARHLGRYLREVSIAFGLGAEDRHVPAANAERFREELVWLDASAASRIRVTRHDGLDHRGICSDERVLAAAVAELTAP